MDDPKSHPLAQINASLRATETRTRTILPLLPVPQQVHWFVGSGYPEGSDKLSEETLREEGFAIFRTGSLRRLSSTHYVVKSQEGNGWHLVELKDGIWMCDCKAAGATCAHLCATQFHRYASKENQEDPDEAHLKCRYCGSIDIAGCGFRYGARGISRRFVCHDCLRKFSIPYTNTSAESKPQELTWLLNQLGQLTSKLTDLLQEMNMKLEDLIDARGVNNGTSDKSSG